MLARDQMRHVELRDADIPTDPNVVAQNIVYYEELASELSTAIALMQQKLQEQRELQADPKLLPNTPVMTKTAYFQWRRNTVFALNLKSGQKRILDILIDQARKILRGQGVITDPHGNRAGFKFKLLAQLRELDLSLSSLETFAETDPWLTSAYVVELLSDLRECLQESTTLLESKFVV